MTVWRLNSHPSDAGRAARWFTRDCLVAIGWGDVGDLRRAAPASSTSIATLIRKVDPDSTDSQLGGQALWCFFHDMVVGDLVLVGDGSVGDVVMRIEGEYEWSGQVSPVAPGDYQHQRRASLTTIDASELWASCGRRIADGEDRRWRLARCAPTAVPVKAPAVAASKVAVAVGDKVQAAVAEKVAVTAAGKSSSVASGKESSAPTPAPVREGANID